jgi:hypothetical protein
MLRVCCKLKIFLARLQTVPVQMPDLNPIEGMWNTQEGSDKILKI